MSSSVDRAVTDAAFYAGLALLAYSVAGVAGAGGALVGCAIFAAVITVVDDE